MKRLRLLISIILLIGNNASFSQTILNAKLKFDGHTINYCIMEPAQAVKGLLVLLPGLGEQPQFIFGKTALPRLLADSGYATLVPDLGKVLHADSFMVLTLNNLVKQLLITYPEAGTKLVIGGMSSGGAIALGYAEYLIERGSIKPLCVFAIDPPLDLERLYASAQRELHYGCGKQIKKGAQFWIGYLESRFGAPAGHEEAYRRASVFSANAENGGRAVWLKDIPVRLYAEPDLAFVQEKYCEKLQADDINAWDLERLQAVLVKLGSKNAEYITTKGKGFHSWNILDAEECRQWVVGLR